MRAELTIVALGRESNRYLLSQLIAKATRKLHRPNTRVPDTMNDALALFCAPSPMDPNFTLQSASIHYASRRLTESAPSTESATPPLQFRSTT
jgi:hypothetical protein